MSDEEVICSFMEPRPTDPPENALEMQICGSPVLSKGGFWVWICCYEDGDVPKAIPISLTLDALHEVEARLTKEQWEQYASLMMDPAGIQHTRFLLHASGEQKIKALAAVLKETR